MYYSCLLSCSWPLRSFLCEFEHDKQWAADNKMVINVMKTSCLSPSEFEANINTKHKVRLSYETK